MITKCCSTCKHAIYQCKLSSDYNKYYCGLRIDSHCRLVRWEPSYKAMADSLAFYDTEFIKKADFLVM